MSASISQNLLLTIPLAPDGDGLRGSFDIYA